MNTRHKLIALVALVVPGLISACCKSGDLRPLGVHDAWAPVPLERDLFASFKPTADECEPASFGPEDFGGEPSYTVKSEGCAFITVEQPSRSSCCEGETLHVRIWHFDLTRSLNATEAHVALAIQDQIIWDEVVQIPSSSGLLAPYLTLGADVDEGTLVQINIRNHGSNSWNILELSAGATPPAVVEE